MRLTKVLFYEVDLLPFSVMRLKFENYTVASLLNNDQIRWKQRTLSERIPLREEKKTHMDHRNPNNLQINYLIAKNYQI